jgi:hypothetical protein
MIYYIPLWEIIMKRFYAELFVSMATYSGRAAMYLLQMDGRELDETIDYNYPAVKELAEKFKGYKQEFLDLDMPMTSHTASKFVDVLTNNKSTYSDYIELVEELENRLHDELKIRVFYSIERNKEPFLSDEALFGENVLKAFPSAAFDIQESAKCLAFERWTSAVFHLSRISEIALVSIGERVGFQSHKPGFGEVLKYMDNQLEKARKDYNNASPLFKGDVEFLSSVTAQMHAVNQAWRQRVAHLDKKYTEEEAMRIWHSTKGLMEQVAEKLSELKE